jgi:Family of unknown function (DUF5946)
VSEALEPCACGALVPRSDGPTHEYIGATPGCWAIFTELSASSPRQQLMVDAYAVQHPGTPSRRAVQSVAVHLISLWLQLEHGAPPPRARDAILAALKIAYRFVWLTPPAWSGVPTIVDVRDGADVREWAEAVWRAWAPHHAAVREWADLAGVSRASR